MGKKLDSTDTYYLYVSQRILKLAPIVGLCAAISISATVLAGISPPVSIIKLIVFDLVCLSYFVIAKLLKRLVVVKDGEVDKKKLMAMEWIMASVILFQWNLITYIFPSADFWGYAPMFVLLTAFMFHSKVVLGEIIGMSVSIAVSWIFMGDKLLPVMNEDFMGGVILRIVALLTSFAVIYFLTVFAGKFAKLAKENYQFLDKQNSELENYGRDIIDFTSELIQEKDFVSGSRVNRLKTYTRIMAEKVADRCPEYGLDGNKIEKISRACVLHDVGKIEIPENILLKKGKLTPDEFEIIKKHCEYGAKTVDKMPDSTDTEYKKYCHDICLYHHEKYDGSGYPYGLKGEEIPIAAQIVSIVDCYDALTNVRPYKERLSHDTALRMIITGECGAFSDNIKACFLACSKQLEQITV